LNVLALFNRNCELVEAVLAGHLLLKCESEFVGTCLQCQEVKLVVFVVITSDIKNLSASDKECWVLSTFNLPGGLKSLSLFSPVLHLDNEVLLLLSFNCLGNSSFRLGCACETLESVLKSSSIG